jgi:hypothetical protein
MKTILRFFFNRRLYKSFHNSARDPRVAFEKISTDKLDLSKFDCLGFGMKPNKDHLAKKIII